MAHAEAASRAIPGNGTPADPPVRSPEPDRPASDEPPADLPPAMPLDPHTAQHAGDEESAVGEEDPGAALGESANPSGLPKPEA